MKYGEHGQAKYMAHENEAVLSIGYPKLRTQNFLYNMYNFAYRSDNENRKL